MVVWFGEFCTYRLHEYFYRRSRNKPETGGHTGTTSRLNFLTCTDGMRNLGQMENIRPAPEYPGRLSVRLSAAEWCGSGCTRSRHCPLMVVVVMHKSPTVHSTLHGSCMVSWVSMTSRAPCTVVGWSCCDAYDVRTTVSLRRRPLASCMVTRPL